MDALLTETLALWGIEGEVRADGDGYAIHVGGECAARVGPGRGVRWLVRSTEGEHECVSVTGALSALRYALGVEGGARLRVTR